MRLRDQTISSREAGILHVAGIVLVYYTVSRSQRNDLWTRNFFSHSKARIALHNAFHICIMTCPADQPVDPLQVSRNLPAPPAPLLRVRCLLYWLQYCLSRRCYAAISTGTVPVQEDFTRDGVSHTEQKIVCGD